MNNAVLPARLAWLVLAVSFCANTYAARPFITDDARVVDPGQCQVESYFKSERPAARSEFGLLPACNPAGRVELTLGGRRVEESGRAVHEPIVQAKTLVKPLETGGFGLAFTLGATKARPLDERARWNPLLNAIASQSLAEDRLVLHFNAGALEERTLGRSLHTWGFGGEFAVTRQVYAIAEVFGQEADPTGHQLGIRYWVVRDRFQIDGTGGWQRGAQWISVGLRFMF